MGHPSPQNALDLRQPIIAPAVPVTGTARQHRKLVAALLPVPEMTGRRVRMPTLFPLWRYVRRVSSAASRLPGFTSLRFALHGWQRRPSSPGAGWLQSADPRAATVSSLQ
ncbi:MAG: hypothetical protein GY696_34360 [Gammaproteobacteria bacterium]|nr:hypothetical protein [Gammaproteobacteria bacterium]